MPLRGEKRAPSQEDRVGVINIMALHSIYLSMFLLGVRRSHWVLLDEVAAPNVTVFIGLFINQDTENIQKGFPQPGDTELTALS